MGVAFTLLTKGRFLRSVNLKIILDQAMIVAVVATGGIYIFSTGNVNLAMGATTVLTATLAVIVYNMTQSIVVMIVFSIAFSMGVMFLSAVLSTIFRITVTFVTIVMSVMLSALQQAIVGGTTLAVPYKEVSQYLTKLQFPFIAFGIFFLFSIVVFNKTKIGRSLKFIGSNKACANQTGINPSNFMLIAFLLSGIGMGLGAVMIIVRTGQLTTTSYPSLNNDALLAIVLGGMSIYGGSKSYIFAGVLGAVIVTALTNGLSMVGVDSTLIQGLRGIVFLLLVFASQKRPKGLPVPEG
jgi:ribose transport system permease protein